MEDLRQQLIKKLEHVAGLTREQAKQQVLENRERFGKDSPMLIQAAETKSKEEADDKARES